MFVLDKPLDKCYTILRSNSMSKRLCVFCDSFISAEMNG